MTSALLVVDVQNAVVEGMPGRDALVATIVDKRHRSAFGDTGLGDLLRGYGVGRVVLVGAQTAFCVDMAGKHALAEGFDVTWVSDGHGNGDQETADGLVPDAAVRALLNRTWSSMRHPGRTVEVVAGDQVRW